MGDEVFNPINQSEKVPKNLDKSPRRPAEVKVSSEPIRASRSATRLSDELSQGISPRSTASPRTRHWATTNMLQQDIVLNDIEKNDSSHARSRTGSVAQEFKLNNMTTSTKVRRHSGDSVDGILAYQSSISGSKYRKFFDFLDATIPKFQNRLNIYCCGFFLLCLFALSENLNYPSSWYGLFFSLIGLDIATAIIDHMFFVYFIDKIFINHFDIAYLLHGFNGPIGMLIAIFFAKNSFDDFKAVKTNSSWDRWIDACVIILLFACIKNWYSRRYYITLLERRFTDKLFQMETWTILLSELSSTKPPKTIKTHYPAGIKGKIEEQREKIGEYIENLENDLAMNGIGTIFGYAVPGLNTLQKKVINVFADLVEATSKYNDNYEDDVDIATQIRRNRGETIVAVPGASLSQKAIPRERKISSATAETGSTMNKLSKEEIKQLKSKLRKRKTFWELAARTSLNMGLLKIYTYNGPVIIRRKFQAKEFGKSLYLHLSRGNKYYITHSLLQSLFENSSNSQKERSAAERNSSMRGPVQKNNPFQSSSGGGNDDLEAARMIDDHDDDSSKHGNYTALRMLSGQYEKDTATLLYESAIELLDPFHLGHVTEEQCMAAVCLVYKEHRYAATSLNDYGELHQSLRGVIDFVFWMVIIVILQTYLSFNIYTEYILPFVTMAFTISFALGPSLGAILQATIFVFFMIPYEVGNKIYIGADPNSRIVGFVRSVTLLHTTISTLNNEVMKIPNHSLFSEKICNLQESGGAVYEVVIVFNLENNSNSLQMKIDEFFERVKSYAIVENKADWQGCDTFLTSINTVNNTASYSTYLTHRDNYQNIGKPLRAREDLLKFIRHLLIQMGLYYNPNRQNVIISTAEIGSEIKITRNNSLGSLTRSYSADDMNSPPLMTTNLGGSGHVATTNIIDMSSQNVNIKIETDRKND